MTWNTASIERDGPSAGDGGATPARLVTRFVGAGVVLLALGALSGGWLARPGLGGGRDWILLWLQPLAWIVGGGLILGAVIGTVVAAAVRQSARMVIAELDRDDD